MNSYKYVVLFLSLAVGLLETACGQTGPRGAQAVGGPSVLITAPQGVRDLLKKWNGKYVFFVHRGAAVKKFLDLDGKVIFIAFINAREKDIGNVVHDAYAFMKAGRIKMDVHVQNNPDVYLQQLAEEPKAVSMMDPRYAAYCRAEERDWLARLEFR